jgi:hypothetical protein
MEHLDTELVKLVEAVVAQIKWDLELGQTEDLEILLAQCPKEYLREYLPEGE